MQDKVNIVVIKPRGKKWWSIEWREIWRYKDLLYFLVMRDIKILYKQTVLGFTWAIIRPLLSMFVFTLIFGKLAKLTSDGVPYAIFNYTALVPWTYFSSSLTTSTQSLIMNVRIFTKVYFPRLFIPLTPILAKLVDFFIAFIILIIMMAWYHIYPTVKILIIPYLVFLMILFSSGVSMWLSALAIQYRDVKYGVQFLAQFLMYAAPVVWSISLIPQKYRLLYGLYPMAGVIEGFRCSLLNTKPIPWDLIISGTISALIIFITGFLYFRWKERIFADVA